ncbi:MAG: Fic family protein [Armatimonadetes bacterium]|nr:Fic family protein [Akkermansiaceae bacterium]
MKWLWLEPFRQQGEMEAPDYENCFEPNLPRRTALNRLNRLREADLVERLGKGRSTLYRLTDSGKARLEVGAARPAPAKPKPRGIHLSASAKSMRTRIHRRFSERVPVEYHRGFFGTYLPNQSSYLPEFTRRKLFVAGSLTGMTSQRLLMDLAWNSSRLDGFACPLPETEQLFQTGNGNTPLSNEAVMILNHKAAIEFLMEPSAEAGFNRRTILNLHALLTADQLRDPAAEGALRQAPLGIAKSTYLPPAVPELIEMYFDQILATAAEIQDPFEQAFFVMVQLPYLQPFLDGNMRVARLAANIPLFQRNLVPLSFVDVSEADYLDGMLAIFEHNDITILREVFVHAYERSTQRYNAIRGAGDPDPFRVKYREAITEQVAELIRARCVRPEAIARLRRWADEAVIENDRKRFIAAAEETLDGIHEGNFARYRVRPAEFEAWQAVWNEVTS